MVKGIEFDRCIRNAYASDKIRYRNGLAMGNGYAVLHPCRHFSFPIEDSRQGGFPIFDFASFYQYIQQFIDYGFFIRTFKVQTDSIPGQNGLEVHVVSVEPQTGKVKENGFCDLHMVMIVLYAWVSVMLL